MFPLGNEVSQSDAVAGVVICDFDDEPQVCPNHLLPCCFIALADAICELNFLLRFQKGRLGDVIEIQPKVLVEF